MMKGISSSELSNSTFCFQFNIQFHWADCLTVENQKKPIYFIISNDQQSFLPSYSWSIYIWGIEEQFDYSELADSLQTTPLILGQDEPENYSFYNFSFICGI